MKALFNPLNERLRAKGLPTAIQFTYGPPQVPTQVGATRVYMCSDDDAGDSVGSAGSPMQNPVGVGVRGVGFKIVIFAHATEQGADIFAHEALARGIANMVAAALHYTVRVTMKTTHKPGRAGFVAIVPESSDGWAGRRYEMSFAVAARIADLTWKGAAAEEATAPSTTTTLNASGAGASDLPNATTRVN